MLLVRLMSICWEETAETVAVQMLMTTQVWKAKMEGYQNTSLIRTEASVKVRVWQQLPGSTLTLSTAASEAADLKRLHPAEEPQIWLWTRWQVVLLERQHIKGKSPSHKLLAPRFIPPLLPASVLRLWAACVLWDKMRKDNRERALHFYSA